MRHTILVLSPLKKMTGNYSTAMRLMGHFNSGQYRGIVEESFKFQQQQDFFTYLKTQKVDFVISLHAYHSGRLLLDCPVPFVLILGGTDVHEYTHDLDKWRLMGKVLAKAQKVIAFGKPLLADVCNKWPDLNPSNICIIPQAVRTSPSSFSIHSYLRNLGKLPPCKETVENHDKEKLFVVVGGIRPVKEPLFLVKTFSDWHINNKGNAYLVFIGPLLDSSYGEGFIKTLQRSPGVLYVDGLSLEDTHATIRDSFALVNSSRSEGMASAILEAMDLGTPVIVRDIPANQDLVQHKNTGLLYHTPQEFVNMAELLLTSPDLGTLLSRRAKEQISNKHSLQAEFISYISIVEESIAR